MIILTAFENYLRSIRGYSENTIRAYTADLRCFARWANENLSEARWSTLTRDDIDAFLTYQVEQGLKPTTTNRQLSAISSLYRFFQRQGLKVDNPCEYESRRKLPQTEPTTINAKQLAKAYHKAHGNTKTMLGILATTGIRLQELLNLKFEDIDFDESKLHIYGKGAKERTVYSTPAVLQTLKGLRETLKASGRIFYMGQRKARYMIYQALAPYCTAAQLSPHAIRHTFATELAKHGASTAAIAKMLGHSHLETSQKYINLAEIPAAHQGIILN